jgi:hypothetical protein
MIIPFELFDWGLFVVGTIWLIEEPTTHELIVNARTAKLLGLSIPNSILVSADEVIE